MRADGWPQVTTVGYANEGFTIYFLCGLDSQKARTLTDPAEIDKAIGLLVSRYPEQKAAGMPMPNPSEVRLITLTPTVISLLDYAKADLVVC